MQHLGLGDGAEGAHDILGLLDGDGRVATAHNHKDAVSLHPLGAARAAEDDSTGRQAVGSLGLGVVGILDEGKGQVVGVAADLDVAHAVLVELLREGRLESDVVLGLGEASGGVLAIVWRRKQSSRLQRRAETTYLATKTHDEGG